jgi:replicative DNA helicase Mcm
MVRRQHGDARLVLVDGKARSAFVLRKKRIRDPSPMAQTQPEPDLVDRLARFYRDYYREELGQLAEHYPQEQRSLTIAYDDVYQYDPDIADDLRDRDPTQLLEHFEEALRQVELPVDVSLGQAHVRVRNLDAAHTYYPGAFSPSDHAGQLRGVRGEVSKATDVYSRLEVATFECQRCGTPTEVPQSDDDFQEPHECHGCERQGPFEINFDQSEFVDGQKLRIQTPPEEAQGEGQDMDVFVEDDLVDVATVGDRVTVTGIVRLDQQTRGSAPTNKFEPYLEGNHIAVEETDAQDVDITAAQRERIHALANGEEGDPLELAADALTTKIYGYDTVKQAIVLALVGGARVEYPGDDFDRGEFHVLLIGDPSTGKSKLVDRAEAVGWRSVGVSGTGATVAGVTATAIQDDFGDGSWTLDAGAAVKAHRGVLAIDELDDMPAEVRSALLEPMSKQTIHITKGGINTHLQTRTAVVAAANPDQDRFDPYQPIAEQFAFSSTLLSRFDLVYTFRDVPDEEQDDDVADHVLTGRDAAKRAERNLDTSETIDTDPEPPVDPDILRKWIALAKQQPKPVFADTTVKNDIKESFTNLRGLYGYDDPDDPVPVTFRTLEGIVRVAEAAAKFEFSETIEQHHVDIATDLVGQSMQDIGKDPETGELDADVHETGTSKSQRDRASTIRELIQEVADEHEDGAPVGTVIERAEEIGIDASKVEHEIEKLKQNGEAVEPVTDHIRYIGRY